MYPGFPALIYKAECRCERREFPKDKFYRFKSYLTSLPVVNYRLKVFNTFKYHVFAPMGRFQIDSNLKCLIHFLYVNDSIFIISVTNFYLLTEQTYSENCKLLNKRLWYV